VLIFNAGSNYPQSGGTFGPITLSSNGSIKLSPASTGSYAGVVIMQPAANTQTLSFSGNSLGGITGTIYAPAAGLSASGNAQLNLALDVDTLALTGNASAQIVRATVPAAGAAGFPAQVLPAAGSHAPAAEDRQLPAGSTPPFAGQPASSTWVAAAPAAQLDSHVVQANRLPPDWERPLELTVAMTLDRAASDATAQQMNLRGSVTLTLRPSGIGMQLAGPPTWTAISESRGMIETVPLFDSILDELASHSMPWRGWEADLDANLVGGALALNPDVQNGQGGDRVSAHRSVPVPAGPMALLESPPAADSSSARLAGAVLVAGYCGRGTALKAAANRRNGRPAWRRPGRNV
jgi:hypothetical protein